MSSSFSRKNISNNSLIASFKESSFAFESKLQRKIPERIFPNSVNSFNTKSDGLSDNSFSNNKENKTIFIELKNKRNFEISFKKTEENTLTVSWLLKETLSKIDELSNEDEFSSEHSEKIAFLTSKDKNFNLDFWLTHLDRSVDVIKDGQILIPFYTDCQYEFNENTENIDINYFHLQKIIGMGGFSDVLLGLNILNFSIFIIFNFFQLEEKIMDCFMQSKSLKKSSLPRRKEKRSFSMRETFGKN